MWPFSIFRKVRKMSIKTIDERFATSAQIDPNDMGALAQQGYTAIICARPDNEEPGQPTFAEVAREAQKHGMTAVHIPVSGAPTPEQIEQFEKAISAAKGPALGYCRGGSRAAALYSAIGR